ncbi:hypothetical protein MNBD_GAMMA06-378 [hydrothermal vent metagenome]|uniref:Uncharacterized protein n=1 Tax=hydrothermal vent metagenome TaxID=652676 RepID=A0A3B0XBG3_9ZZZZ
MEFFEDWVEQHPEFKDIYQDSLVCDIDEFRKDYAVSQKKWALKHEEKKFARLAYIRKNLTGIQDGSVYPQVLHNLSADYFDHYANISGETGLERLADFLDHDKELIQAVKMGMRKVFGRADLPQTSEIFSLAAEQREHYIRLPFLTCMEELYQENPSMFDSLSDDLAAKALAFWYTYGAGTEPAWVKPLNFSRPVLAANILIEYVSAMLLVKEQHIHGTYQLQHDPGYHEIAKLAAIPLLKNYPVRASKQLVSTLENLLKAAIEYCDKTILLELIAEKLALKSLKVGQVAQHVYWLAAGLVVAPIQYEPMVRKYVGNNGTRINYLSTFLYGGFHFGQSNFPLPPNIIGYIVELLAPRSTPYWSERNGSYVTRSMHDGDYVRSLLNRLSENTDIESAQVIEYLLALPQLSTWYELLRNIRKTQRISRRESLFQYPNASAVALTLNNLKPANVADLAALVMDNLKKLSGEMRTNNTDSYKRFWNEDSYERAIQPKVENSCRDYLVERFREFFSKLDVDVQPETHEVNNKRADMRLSFNTNGSAYHLPIEIKLDHSSDLWRAIHEQLIPLYTVGPETQGRGIFLVIWFHEKNMPAPASGKKPKTIAELKTRLIETLTPQEQKLIDVFVLDVSKPDNS